MSKPSPLPAYTAPAYTTETAKAGVFAIKALESGKANEGQQKIALAFIIDHLSALYDDPFYADDKGGERETAYALGRMFVGRELRKIIARPFDLLTKK